MALGPAPAVLIIAGTDSSGGAGLSRDVETVTAFGAAACPAVTAVTAQTDGSVATVRLMPASLVAAQIRTARMSRPVAAMKIGMLGSGTTVTAVAGALAGYDGPLILDPVLASTSGRSLLSPAGRAALLQDLMPLSTLVTPNLPELALLAGPFDPDDEGSVIDAAHLLFAAGGPQALLVKGGHASGDTATDLLIRRNGDVTRFSAPRRAGTLRGTGCMLASGIAACLARGSSLAEAVTLARRHVQERFAALA